MPSTKRRGRSVKRAGVVGPRSKAGSNRPAPGGGGSGRGASARRRRLAAGEEATQHALAAAARATDEAKPDEALFFVDRGSGIGADTPRAKARAKAAREKAEKSLRRARPGSKHEARAVEKMAAKRSRRASEEAVGSTGAERKAPEKVEVPVYDVWSAAGPTAGGSGDAGAIVAAHGGEIVEAGDSAGEGAAAPKRKRARFDPARDRVAPIPAVEAPKPGSSYNPSVDDHQDALGEAVAMELARLERQKAERETRLHTDVTLTLDDIKKASDDESSTDGEDDAAALSAAKAAKAAEKKTVAQRNKERRHAALLAEHAERRAQRELAKEAARTKLIAKELDAKAVAKLQEKKEREERRLARMAVPVRKRGGKIEEDPTPVDVALTEELSGSLRGTKMVATSLALERYHSLQKRGLFERGKKVGKKKPRRKPLTEKPWVPKFADVDVDADRRKRAQKA